MSYDGIIRRFQIIGETKDIAEIRPRYEKVLVDMMNDEGYVPILDLDSVWFVKFNHEKGVYIVRLVRHGLYFGEGASKCKGMIEGTTLEKHIQKELSNPYWLESD